MEPYSRALQYRRLNHLNITNANHHENMNLNFTKLFPSAKSQPLKIRANRSLLITNSDGETKPLEAGSEAEITRAQFNTLDHGDVSILSSEKGKVKATTDPTPARPAIEPIPKPWEPLPQSFHDFWQIQEEFRVARLHVAQIAECRIQTFGTNASPFAGNPDVATVLVNRFEDSKVGENVVYHRREISLTDPATQQLERYLVRAEGAAADYLERLIQTKGLPMQRAFLDCGAFRITTSKDLQAIVNELADIGFSLFATRIAALGLHEQKIRTLYYGSADHSRYGSHNNATRMDECFGGIAEDGSTRIYVDAPISSTASHSLNQLARIAELQILLESGRKELAKTQRAAA
jgi:hypothetical protein